MHSTKPYVFTDLDPLTVFHSIKNLQGNFNKILSS